LATYTVQMNNIHEVVNEMQLISKGIHESLVKLENGTAAHLAEWTSDARNVYTQVKAQWDQAAAEMTRLANNAAMTLNNVNETYGHGEQSGVRLWQG
jgi:uncharacterized protein YukE